jgi:glycosyltransferase involved in cell wall biosynthesis
MKLLHVGSGFRPWRIGGLVAYAEDLMDEQVRRGHDVTYFFSGRLYPLLGGPRLRRWRRRGVAMLEVINSPLYDHGRQPELELSEPRVEEMFERALRELRPDAIHVQELAGLPFSVLDVARKAGIPTIFTLQDYFPLCSTFKLLDSGGRVCLRREIGADCVATTAADPRDPGLLIEATMRHHTMLSPRLRRIFESPLGGPPLRLVEAGLARLEVARRRRAAPSSNDPAAVFQRRRDENVDRLNDVDALVAMSRRVAEIYSQLGVDDSRLRTVQLTLGHIERLTPRRRSVGAPITFATLAGFESAPKGGRVLLEAMRLCERQAREKRFRLVVFGDVHDRFAELVERTPGLELRGRFVPRELDAMLDEVDVGLMPSVWEEAYGYAGVEFLAKGIPVIANAIGGMTDYTRDGETGWLNRSCSGAELAEIMAGVIERPQQVAELNEKLVEGHDSVVKTMSRHADEMDDLYHEVSGRA